MSKILFSSQPSKATCNLCAASSCGRDPPIAGPSILGGTNYPKLFPLFAHFFVRWFPFTTSRKLPREILRGSCQCKKKLCGFRGKSGQNYGRQKIGETLFPRFFPGVFVTFPAPFEGGGTLGGYPNFTHKKTCNRVQPERGFQQSFWGFFLLYRMVLQIGVFFEIYCCFKGV